MNKKLSRVIEGTGLMTSQQPSIWSGANSCRMSPFWKIMETI